MTRRRLWLLPALAATLCPAATWADVRIEERATSLNSAVTRWTLIKGDRRSIVTRADLEVGGVLYNAGARYGAYVEIARPDQELIWELDPQERAYRVVKADQFSRLLQRGIQAPRNPNEQPLRTLYRAETTAIEVVPTGRRKQIAGLEAEEVKARVVIGATNLVSGKQLVFTFDQETWITKDERLVKETREFEQAYVEAFGSAASLSQAQVMAGEWNDAFINHLRAMADRVRALGGYPLASTTSVTEEAVAQSKNEKNNSRVFTVAASEVRRVVFDSIPDGEFELPPGYIDSDTKVAVAPRPGTPEPLPMVAVAPKPEPPMVAVAPKPEPPMVAVAPKPEPPMVAVAPKPEPPPVVAPRPEPMPAVAVRPRPTSPPLPEPPVGARPAVVRPLPEPPAPGPTVAVRATPPLPEAPGGIPSGRTIQTPTNIIVEGPRRPVPLGPAVARNGVDPTVAPTVTAGQLIYTVTRDVPEAVTIDEPEIELDKKKKKKR